MLIENKKYYLITYYHTFFEAKFIGTRPYACRKDVTEYIFRTKAGDLFLRSDDRYKEMDNNYLTHCKKELKLEIAKRVYRNKPVGRSPFDKEKLLEWVIKHHPDKLL